MTKLQEKVQTSFTEIFGAAPEIIVRAPGRVNLIGEHTDYNEGYALPMAIDRAALIALRPRTDKRVRLYSREFDKWGEFELDDLERAEGWLEYPKGVAWALQQQGHDLNGFEGVLTSDVPRGSGLSSSAALELVVARAFYEISEFPWDATKMALAGQACENDWVGANTGVMDQLASAAGQRGYALFIDFRTLENKPYPLPEHTSVVVLDTMTRHSHSDSGEDSYNARRADCERAAEFFGAPFLRDVNLSELKKAEGKLDDKAFRRARHVISEDARTLASVEAMKRADAPNLGKMMNSSHDSLRHDFEVTNDALNEIVACARAQASCHGARMTGGGFGGCAVALVKESEAAAFVQTVKTCYVDKTATEPEIYICSPAEGAGRVA